MPKAFRQKAKVLKMSEKKRKKSKRLSAQLKQMQNSTWQAKGKMINRKKKEEENDENEKKKRKRCGSLSFHSFRVKVATEDASARSGHVQEKTSDVNTRRYSSPSISSQPRTHIHLKSFLSQPPELWNYA